MASFRTLLGVVYSDDYGFVLTHVVNDVDTDDTTSTYVSYQITRLPENIQPIKNGDTMLKIVSCVLF